MRVSPDFSPCKGRASTKLTPGDWPAVFHDALCYIVRTELPGFFLSFGGVKADAQADARSWRRFMAVLAAFPLHPTSQVWREHGAPRIAAHVQGIEAGGWAVRLTIPRDILDDCKISPPPP